jgi:acyl-CoA synthetase (AMP-forming)/AMP-acid ligase II
VICPLPQYHIYAFTLAVLFMLWRGHPLVTQARFDLRRFCAQVEAHRPARAYLVPPILLALSKEACVDEYDFSSLAMISSAAAPLDAELEQSVGRRLGCGVKQAWGMSELSPLGTWPADTDLAPDKVGSVGPPVPSTSVRIVALAADEAAPSAADALVNVPPGAEGELLVSGPQVMGGYLNLPDASARTLWTVAAAQA